MNWFELLGIISLIFAIAGSLLNNRKMIVCFPIWMIANLICFGMHLQIIITLGQGWSLAAKDVAFMYICIDGYFRWRKK